ncbi:MAG: DsrE family protein [Beijerinckiaceae bacterium]|jgi:uncharacterized protein|nr:DsrE family protein [Beijerinckiaceae bacterium]
MVSRKQTAAYALIGIAATFGATTAILRKPARSAPAQNYFELFDPQNVVYHVHKGGGWFGRRNRDLVSIINNHINAVGEGFLDLRVVLQGNGIDILQQAMTDENLAASITALRKKGVRFLVCNNTLAGHGIDYRTELFGVKKADIVSAGVAEVARLQAAGFVYLKF